MHQEIGSQWRTSRSIMCDVTKFWKPATSLAATQSCAMRLRGGETSIDGTTVVNRATDKRMNKSEGDIGWKWTGNDPQLPQLKKRVCQRHCICPFMTKLTNLPLSGSVLATNSCRFNPGQGSVGCSILVMCRHPSDQTYVWWASRGSRPVAPMTNFELGPCVWHTPAALNLPFYWLSV